MRYDYSTQLRDDVNSMVRTAFKTAGIVNVTLVAEKIRVRNLAENVALEDVEHLVVQAALLLGAAVEFDTLSNWLALSENGVVDGDEPAISTSAFSQLASIQ
ncbi:hypothetical protein ACVDG5_008645 [Mesorhizobium sp. ORM6]